MVHHREVLRPVFAAVICAFAASGAGAEGRERYSILNPTPRDEMREMSTDRPDMTESPYTVDAGHMQLELSFIDYIRESGNERYSWSPLNFKVGLTDSTDLQLVFDPYTDDHLPGRAARGAGDSQIRLKHNWWGNNEGSTAFAMMPFIQLPTGRGDLSSRRVEGGLILPLALSITEETGAGIMGEIDIVNDESGEYSAEFFHTATVGSPLTDALGMYLEFAGLSAGGSGGIYEAVLGGGMTYALSPDTQLDGGVNAGLNDAADDLNLFIGISVRS